MPAVVQVDATAGSVTAEWPVAGIVVCALITALHTEQWEPSVLPAVVQVAATAGSVTAVCPVAGIASVLVSPQASQVKVFSPSVVQVGWMVTVPASQLC